MENYMKNLLFICTHRHVDILLKSNNISNNNVFIYLFI